MWVAHCMSMLASLGDAYVFALDHEGAFEVCSRFFDLSQDALDFYSSVKLTGSCLQLVESDRDLDEDEREELTGEYLDAAFVQLRRAIDAGFEHLDKADTSPRLVVIRDDPRYAEIMDEARARIIPETQ